MATRVTLQSLPDGQVVVVKQSLPTDDSIRRQEARWLATADHQGIVRLVGTTEDPFTIRTAHAGTTTLRTARPTPPTAARLLASACETLAHLHDHDMAHGKLSMDHVIVSGDGQTTLCSPDGQITDPSADLTGLSEIVRELLTRWDSEGVEMPNKSEWNRLLQRLSESDMSNTARRAQVTFARLGVAKRGRSLPRTRPRSSISGKTISRRTISRRTISKRTLSVVGAAIVIASAVASLSLLTAAAAPPLDSDPAAELLIGSDLYRLNDPSHVGVAVPMPCPGQPDAVVLDTNSVIWVFAEARDGVQAKSLAQVRGATDLVASTSDGCGQVWAIGPAGQSLIVGN